MGRDQRRKIDWKLAGLGALAVVTIATAGFALQSQPAPAPEAIAPAPSVTITPAAVRAEMVPDQASALAAIRALVTGPEPLVISVMGDSTGNATGEWVDLWAAGLAQYGTVTLHQWDEKAGAWKAQPKVAAGPARGITIWNASHPGANYNYPLQRLDVMSPEKPSILIHSFGHNVGAQRADAGAMDLFAALEKKWGGEIPTAIILQNPARNTRELPTQHSVDALRDWAGRAGYPVIDVNTAFKESGESLGMLLIDDVHPNPAGQRIWADTVIAALS